MKSIKLLMATAMLAIGSTAAMAQASYTDKDGNECQFKRHWFLDVQAGGQYTVGEASFSDLLSPNFQGAIGYQFSPVFGLRGQINGIWSKGGWNGYKATKDGTPYTASYKWKYVAPGVDFMFNLSNLFCGWNPNRVFNATAFVGGGINWAGANQEVNDLAANIRNQSNYLLEYLWQGKKVRPYLEFQVDTGSAVRANLLSLPEIFQQIVALIPDVGSQVVYLLVSSCPVDTTTYEGCSVEHAVRVPATEEVREVEHKVHTRSYIFPFVAGGIRSTVLGSLVSVPSALAPDTVNLTTESENRRELVADGTLEVRRKQV